MNKTFSLLVLGFLGSIIAACQSTAASNTVVSWVTLHTSAGETVSALYAEPKQAGRRPAVIYNHGTGVRQFGYDGAAAKGYDVKDYVRAIADAGYVALAPIREFNSDTARFERGQTVGSEAAWDGVVEGGIRTVHAARAYLTASPRVAADKIAVIGFSEGGNVTLWSLLENANYAAAVLMSPATLRSARKFGLRSAGKDPRIETLTLPVLLTVGADDMRQIRRVTSRLLAPRLSQVSQDFAFKDKYPGGHKWFHKVRPEHWRDVTAFLHCRFSHC
ncbi:MAG: hypothetical protein HOL07_06495 [Rhodospirillaceae bacterium]|jgi:dienelactone hydrolase|nr:hypothetical protein [Rhodospirillaceae bacterium]MBT7027689.1 hypothetical protein [Verrucomicrobiota bacterium]MBT7365720.1 hypothetical protein [Rhodospirillaceae bacterium]